MKRRLKTTMILCICILLGAGMSGCAGKSSNQVTSAEVQISSSSDESTSGTDRIENENGETGIDSEEANWGKEENGSEEGFYGGANLAGRVVAFTDKDITITPQTLIVNKDGSMEGGVAAPGYESEEDNIIISYTDSTVFQTIYFSMSLQEESSREDADKSIISVGTNVDIFGTCQDAKHWSADKIAVEIWQ